MVELFEVLKDLLEKRREGADLGTLFARFEPILASRNIAELKRDQDLLLAGEKSRSRKVFEKSPGQGLTVREKLRIFPVLVRNTLELKRAYKASPLEPERKTIEEEEIAELEPLAEKLGVDSFGFTGVRKEEVFRNRGLLYSKALVFSVEMDSEDVSTAPSFRSLKSFQKSYVKTGIVANKLTEFLRNKGFGAQSGPGLGGFALYPVLAKRAGLGEFGRHGLLITPENGSLHRLGAVYINVENLSWESRREPKSDWIEGFCRRCGICIEACPPKAIHRQPRTTKGDNLTFIDEGKCGSYFAENYGCSICIKECPFGGRSNRNG